MDMQQIIDAVRGFDGSLVVTPSEGSGHPELSWGDAYFYHAPDGRMPERTQPFSTIITKNYPDDTASQLDAPGRFRVNIHVGRHRADELTREGADPAQEDRFFLHPLYGTAGWVCVVDPASRTAASVVALLREAHDTARARSERRAR